MTLIKQHINLFEKLHKLYVDSDDVELLKINHNLNQQEAIEYSNSAGAFRFLNEFNSNFDCQSIGFNGKKEMREAFHQWLQTKKWKGTKNITSLSVLLRKFSTFRKETEKTNQLDVLVDKKKGNKNSLKFNDTHIEIFNSSYYPNDFDKTYQNYISSCKNLKTTPVSRATVYNYYKSEYENLITLFNANNIEHLHAQFINLADFDVLHKQLDCTKKEASELINSIAVLEMLNYENLKLEIKQIGFKTKEAFLKELLVWLKDKN